MWIERIIKIQEPWRINCIEQVNIQLTVKEKEQKNNWKVVFRSLINWINTITNLNQEDINLNILKAVKKRLVNFCFIDANKTNTIRHAYYREYRELQNLCLLILQHQKHQIGMGSKKVYGLLFDGAWLWEEYMNSIVDEIFYHPMNKATKGSQRLFDHNRGLIYPDFISRDSEARVIADAKYKPIDNIGNKDYLQVLAYMFRFDAKKGFYFYPEMGEEEGAVMWLNRGSTYEKNVEAREDICLIKHGFQIPTGIDEYSAFTEQMRCNEIKFLDGILTFVK